jgi:hypothetical protein
VQPAVPRHGPDLLGGGRDRDRVGHVEGQGPHVASARGGQRLRGLRVAHAGEDGPARRREPQRRRPADPGRRTGDDGQASHAATLPRRGVLRQAG